MRFSVTNKHRRRNMYSKLPKFLKRRIIDSDFPQSEIFTVLRRHTRWHHNLWGSFPTGHFTIVKQRVEGPRVEALWGYLINLAPYRPLHHLKLPPQGLLNCPSLPVAKSPRLIATISITPCNPKWIGVHNISGRKRKSICCSCGFLDHSHILITQENAEVDPNFTDKLSILGDANVNKFLRNRAGKSDKLVP